MSESNAVGDWSLIGYKMADNTNFQYTGNKTGGTVALSGITANMLGWQAQNKVALNDCTTSAPCKWQLQMNSADGGNGVAYTPAESDNAKALTPSFDKLGTATLGTVTGG